VSVQATLNREHDWSICFHSAEVYNLPTTRVPDVVQVCKALKHFQGEWLAVHYEAFYKGMQKTNNLQELHFRADHNSP
jgi:hypothetical protein